MIENISLEILLKENNLDLNDISSSWIDYGIIKFPQSSFEEIGSLIDLINRTKSRDIRYIWKELGEKDFQNYLVIISKNFFELNLDIPISSLDMTGNFFSGNYSLKKIICGDSDIIELVYNDGEVEKIISNYK